MSTTARRDERLLDACFTRPLSPREHERLDALLLSSPELLQRYRRLQLAERVAAHGPEGALETPSFAETDRIAARLGLLQPAPASARWRAWLRRPPWIFQLTLAVGLALLAFTLVPRDVPEHIQMRGQAGAQVSFAAYRLSPQGQFHQLEPGDAVHSKDRLKLRMSWAEAPTEVSGALWVAMIDAQGQVRTEALQTPSGQIAAVPGVVGLWGLAPGSASVYVVSAPGLQAGALAAAVRSRPSEDALRAQLNAYGVLQVPIEVLEEPEAP